MLIVFLITAIWWLWCYTFLFWKNMSWHSKTSYVPDKYICFNIATLSEWLYGMEVSLVTRRRKHGLWTKTFAASIRKAAQRLARSSWSSTKICPKARRRKARKPPVGTRESLRRGGRQLLAQASVQPKPGKGFSELRNVRNSGSSCVSRSNLTIQFKRVIVTCLGWFLGW